jgi:hypothetical protein
MRANPILSAAVSLLPLALLGGCAHHHHHDDQPGPVVSVEPVPDTYVYYSDPAYYHGHYDHDYYYWNDREGRAHREMRDEHERHVREHPTYEGRSGERGRENNHH